MLLLFALNFFLLLFLAVALSITGIMLLYIRDSLVSKVPFVPVRTRALVHIVTALELQPNSLLVDLGCGDARVLRAGVRAVPGVRGVGYDRGIIPSTLARLRTKSLPITIHRSDLFAADLSSATHLYCYLYPELMTQLVPKIKAECAPGTRIVSCDFPFPDWTPQVTIPINQNQDPLARTLYVYVT